MGEEPAFRDTCCFAMPCESLAREYPLYSTSLLHLIKTSETNIEKLVK